MLIEAKAIGGGPPDRRGNTNSVGTIQRVFFEL
jgi:hypothetical protein